MKTSARTFPTFEMVGNMPERIQPSNVPKFSCIRNSLASANPKGTQNLLRAFTQSHKCDRPKSTISTGFTCCKFYYTCSRDSHMQRQQWWNNIQPLVILTTINNNSHQSSSSTCDSSSYCSMPWGVYVLFSTLPSPHPSITIIN